MRQILVVTRVRLVNSIGLVCRGCHFVIAEARVSDLVDACTCAYSSRRSEGFFDTVIQTSLSMPMPCGEASRQAPPSPPLGSAGLHQSETIGVRFAMQRECCFSPWPSFAKAPSIIRADTTARVHSPRDRKPRSQDVGIRIGRHIDFCLGHPLACTESGGPPDDP
jgi:hypothetical protein